MKIALKEKNGRTTLKTVRRNAARIKKSTAPATPPGPNFRVQKILVPLDFSACSTKALDYAVAFAQPGRTEIILLHVVEPISYPMYGQAVMPEYSALETGLIDTGRQHLAQFSRAKIAEFGPMKLIVSQGSPWGEIVDTAKNETVDLIIIPTHGHTGLRHVLLGSTAERVVRHAPCPVLVVREREREFVPVHKT